MGWCCDSRGPGDVDAMVELFTEIQDEPLARWLGDLLSGDHPKVTYSDYTLVEDVPSRRIVSFMGLISQTWSYGGIPFGCGQVEAVVTHPEYRRRGLVRSQIEVLHALSASRGELMQFIFGIPWFYRQFGYEYALHFGGGARIDLDDFPQLARDAKEPYNIRPATSDDLAFLKKCINTHATGSRLRRRSPTPSGPTICGATPPTRSRVANGSS